MGKSGLILAIFVGSASVARAAPTIEDVLPDARAAGMGGAYTAAAEDAPSVLYNPAGIAGLQDPELAGGVQRYFGAPTPLGGVYLGAARPLSSWPSGAKAVPGTALGVSYYAIRFPGVADKDTFLLTYGSKLNLDSLPTPVRWGTSARFVDFRSGNTTKQGFGIDGGLIADGPGGVKFGAAVTELMVFNISNLNTPTFSVGANYLWRDWILGEADVRTRSGRTTLNPGLEFRALSGLLRFRTGVGLDWAGVDQVALGFGVDFSPLVVDFAFTIPTDGLDRNSGSYDAALTYRFGAPPFYGRFIGQASETAAKLRDEAQQLENQKTLIEQEIARDQASKTVFEQELSTLQAHVEDARKRARDLDSQVEEREAAPPPPAPLPPARKPSAPSWPKRHVVEEGDTLRSIASTYYGDPTAWEAIYQANPDKIDRGLPRVGAELVIPAPPK